MCGIIGAVEWERSLDVADVKRATDRIRHRGPDECGYLFDQVAPIETAPKNSTFLNGAGHLPCQLGFGHRRLAILDLATGQQPMFDSTSEWAIVYNGEIYNHAELRKALIAEGATFHTDHSDTETLLVGFAKWGTAVLPKVNGMFAAAIYHRTRARLWLVRDRFGKKPIYYRHAGGRLVFASELKALVEYLGETPRLDWEALGDYMLRGCIHEPRTIYQGVSKVPAAGCVEVDLRAPGGRLHVLPRYWNFLPPEKCDESRSDADWLAELEHVLDAAVKARLLADVPVGAFLSGGLDSATVCALASRHTSEPLRAFTIASSDPATDESPDAAVAAQRLNLRHVVARAQFDPQTLLSDLVNTFDEPFADLSMAPTQQVARLAAREVKVVVTGDGADEFFAGYGVFGRMTHRTTWERVPVLDPVVRAIGRRIPPTARGGAFIGRNFGGHGLDRYRAAVESRAMTGFLHPDVTKRFRAEWPRLAELWQRSAGCDMISRVSLLQGMTYLTDDILVKVDRATMSCSLEARAPFLDNGVVEFAGRLPARLRFEQGRGKRILRRLAEKWYPASHLDKPKRGFIVPLKKWLQNELRAQMESLVDCDLFDRKRVARLIELQLRTQRDYSPAVWRLMVLQQWLNRWKPLR